MAGTKTKNKRGKGGAQRRIETFRCRRCGSCCTGQGFVNVEEGECLKIADFLELSLQRFLDEYTRGSPGYERWLVEGEGEDEPCIFLEWNKNGLASCRVEGGAKPKQCKTFPTQWRRKGFEKWCAAFKEEVDS